MLFKTGDQRFGPGRSDPFRAAVNSKKASIHSDGGAAGKAKTDAHASF